MNYTIILIEAIVMVALFTAMIIIPLVKNPVWWIDRQSRAPRKRDE